MKILISSVSEDLPSTSVLSNKELGKKYDMEEIVHKTTLY